MSKSERFGEDDSALRSVVAVSPTDKAQTDKLPLDSTVAEITNDDRGTIAESPSKSEESSSPTASGVFQVEQGDPLCSNGNDLDSAVFDDGMYCTTIEEHLAHHNALLSKGWRPVRWKHATQGEAELVEPEKIWLTTYANGVRVIRVTPNTRRSAASVAAGRTEFARTANGDLCLREPVPRADASSASACETSITSRTIATIITIATITILGCGPRDGIPGPGENDAGCFTWLTERARVRVPCLTTFSDSELSRFPPCSESLAG